MQLEAIIFDMDGVICHTNPFHSLAWKAFLERYGVQATEEEFQDHMYGKSNSYILQHFLKRSVTGPEFDRLEQEKEGLFREIYAPHVAAIAGFEPFLASLKAAGLPTGVATSAPQANLDLIVDTLGIRGSMESLMASEHVIKHKPDPEVYLTSANNLGVNPSNCIVFEDSHSGIRAGLAAGMKVVGVLSTYTKAQLPVCHAYVDNYYNLSLPVLRQWVEME
jgi:beta-phosphoglucomutase family hydrolase